jgi:DNA (cytosine-5)-methyltransferase 1
MEGNVMRAVSLFSCSGIGDIGLEAAGIETVVANEIVSERCQILRSNYKNCTIIEGDIWSMKSEIVSHSKDIDFVLATPPCQGMSSNGAGKLLDEIRKGNRPKMDPRNRLIIPAVEIISEIQPRVFMLENVPEMEETIILDRDDKPTRILDFVTSSLPGYVIQYKVIQCADYGLGQNRKRLITIGLKSAEENLDLFPQETHSKDGKGSTKRHVTLRDVIGSFPKLDASKGKESNLDFHPYHYVSTLEPRKYDWISKTPPEQGAFDNQCHNDECLFQDNPKHSAKKIKGVNKASDSTPIHCLQCGELLPRPVTGEAGEEVLMKGFTSAYRRMKWDKIAPTLTQNLGYPSSDTKLHPDQNRVLSIAEALCLQSIPNSYLWKCTDKNGDIKDSKFTLIRDSIGESVPPMIIETLAKHVISLL